MSSTQVHLITIVAAIGAWPVFALPALHGGRTRPDASRARVAGGAGLSRGTVPRRARCVGAGRGQSQRTALVIVLGLAALALWLTLAARGPAPDDAVPVGAPSGLAVGPTIIPAAGLVGDGPADAAPRAAPTNRSPRRAPHRYRRPDRRAVPRSLGRAARRRAPARAGTRSGGSRRWTTAVPHPRRGSPRRAAPPDVRLGVSAAPSRTDDPAALAAPARGVVATDGLDLADTEARFRALRGQARSLELPEGDAWRTIAAGGTAPDDVSSARGAARGRRRR